VVVELVQIFLFFFFFVVFLFFVLGDLNYPDRDFSPTSEIPELWLFYVLFTPPAAIRQFFFCGAVFFAFLLFVIFFTPGC